MIVAFIVTLMLNPFNSSFYPEKYSRYKDWRRPFEFSIVLFLDVLLNMRTGLVQVETDIITLDGKKVFKNYLQGWFFIDFISSLPFDGIYLALVDRKALDPDDVVCAKWARVSVIIRFLLILRLLRYLRRIELVNQLYKNI